MFHKPEFVPRVLPGHLGLLSQQQQDGLGVEQQCPAGQTEEQQDDDAPLQDDPHTQQVLRPKRLNRGISTQALSSAGGHSLVSVSSGESLYIFLSISSSSNSDI